MDRTDFIEVCPPHSTTKIVIVLSGNFHHILVGFDENNKVAQLELLHNNGRSYFYYDDDARGIVKVLNKRFDLHIGLPDSISPIYIQRVASSLDDEE